MLKKVCYRCKGTGSVIIWIINRPEIVDCTDCGGTGEAKGD